MIRNYFRLAARRIAKSKVYSFINIFGLVVAIAAFFLIVQYVSFESSFDQFHVNKDQIVRVALEQYENGELKNNSARTYAGLADYMQQNLPEVTGATRFMKIPANTGFLFRHKGQVYNEWGGEICADSNFFKVFPSLLIRGDASIALKHPNSIVISESVAKMVFGDEDPMGKHLDPMSENREAPYVVTGILRDIPANSHFHFKFVIRLEEEWPEIVAQDWGSTFAFTYATISKQADLRSVGEKANALLGKVAKDNPQVTGSRIVLQPITGIHLGSELKDEYEANGSKLLNYILGGIAVLILVIAWINYVNIETGRFLVRAREVGVRRIIGSGKYDLALQFLIEFVQINFIALVFAGVILYLLLPHFSYFTDIPVHGIDWSAPQVWVASVLFFVMGSVFIGIYPALLALRLNPAAMVNGSFGGRDRGRSTRKLFLVVQFFSSLVLMAFLTVVRAQIDYMRRTDKKIDVERVVAVRNPTAYSDEGVNQKYQNFELLEQKLLQDPAVDMVSTSSAIPGTEIGFTFVNLIKRSKTDAYDPTRYKTIFVGENYIPLYGIRMLAGRNFYDDAGNTWKEPWDRKDWKKIILNVRAANSLGFRSPEDAVNQIVQFQLWGDDFEGYEVVGVTEDFHHEAANKEIFPMIISVNYNSFQQVYYSIRLRAGTDPREALTSIEDSWRSIFPEKPFEYFFIDEYYDQQFKSELYFSRIFSLFSLVAILISSLGIFGMTLFEANTRTKEVSIRKVFGASIPNLLMLLSRDYAKIIAWSSLISFPVTWIVAIKWLAVYPERIEVSPKLFLFPVLVIIFMVAVTCSYQTWRASHANPVNHLKHE